MIRLKNILVEEEPYKPREDPNKILGKNKETGQSYCINKDNFDPSVHEKPEGTKEKKKEEKPSSDKKGGGIMAKLKAEKKRPHQKIKKKRKKNLRNFLHRKKWRKK